MKTRILLVAVIVGSLAICGLNAIKLYQLVVRMDSEARTERNLRLRVEAALAQAHKAEQLALTAVKSAEAERDEARLEASGQRRRSENLTQELSKVRHELDQVQAAMAMPGELPKTSTATLAGRIETLEAALGKARQENITLNRSLWYMSEKLPLEPCRWGMPEDLNGKVVAVDPKWEFLVLDAGEDQGAFGNGELLVSRGGELVAKVKIQHARKDYSIASVVPGWKLGEVTEGDSFMVFTE